MEKFGILSVKSLSGSDKVHVDDLSVAKSQFAGGFGEGAALIEVERKVGRKGR